MDSDGVSKAVFSGSGKLAVAVSSIPSVAVPEADPRLGVRLRIVTGVVSGGWEVEVEMMIRVAVAIGVLVVVGGGIGVLVGGGIGVLVGGGIGVLVGGGTGVLVGGGIGVSVGFLAGLDCRSMPCQKDRLVVDPLAALSAVRKVILPARVGSTAMNWAINPARTRLKAITRCIRGIFLFGSGIQNFSWIDFKRGCQVWAGASGIGR